ncbi:MAG: methyltransferase domain-containing protein [Gemmatimonadaceae bacterium]|nr:methyltransferase domain-containing protein [Gemmatimonadaceae bacterium]
MRWTGRAEPFSRQFGGDRGTPICRLYIADFLEHHCSDIRGNTLEIADDTYIKRYGGAGVSKADILHLDAAAPGATIIGDLTVGDNIESDRFDCVILTQTLNVIFDLEAAVGTVHRILKPGGVVLATMPGISQISQYDMNRWGEYWRFTTASAEKLFNIFAGSGTVEVRSRGNLPAAVAYLQGLSVEDVGRRRLEPTDPDYQLLITVRAVKGRASPEAASR